MLKQGRESLGNNPKIHLLFLRVGVDPSPPTCFESRSQNIPGRDTGLGMGVVSPKAAENRQSRAWVPHPHSHSQLSARFLGLCALFCRHVGLSAAHPGNRRAHGSPGTRRSCLSARYSRAMKEPQEPRKAPRAPLRAGAGQCLPAHLGSCWVPQGSQSSQQGPSCPSFGAAVCPYPEESLAPEEVGSCCSPQISPQLVWPGCRRGAFCAKGTGSAAQQPWN